MCLYKHVLDRKYKQTCSVGGIPPGLPFNVIQHGCHGTVRIVVCLHIDITDIMLYLSGKVYVILIISESIVPWLVYKRAMF